MYSEGYYFFPDSVGSSGNVLPLASAGGTTKYRALFEFSARSEDELSFQPGDVILVFESHAAEPGWKAGQIRDKVRYAIAEVFTFQFLFHMERSTKDFTKSNSMK